MIAKEPEMLSLLMWECGLKHMIMEDGLLSAWSLLMWECGLKQPGIPVLPRVPKVTPYVGVWIETAGRQHVRCIARVTPYVGVWIETY